MPQSLSAVHVHLVFSTKDRRPILQDKGFRDSVHSYLGSVSAQIGCPPIRVGGVEDHVHILATLSRTLAQADWVKELKRVSSLWIAGQGRDLADFRWQSGYGIFSVSRSRLDEAIAYIDGQEEHHRKVSFQDEFRKLLAWHDIAHDERYVWD